MNCLFRAEEKHKRAKDKHCEKRLLLPLARRDIIVTIAVDPVSMKSRLTSTVECSFGIITDCIQATVVSFDGTLVDI